MYKKLFFVIVLAIALSTCKKDDTSPQYNFKDQKLAGLIAGNSWSMLSGYGDFNIYNQDTTISITLYNFSSSDPCSATSTSDEVFFTIPAKIGIYLLKMDFSDPQLNRTVTLFQHDSYGNYIATEGAVEILTITDTHITGRIDARCDDENYVNGNFDVKICD